MSRHAPDRPRLVLASLVPVEARADPLDHAMLPRTDFGESTVLRLKTPRLAPSDSELSKEASLLNNQAHDDERRQLEKQLLLTKQLWAEQQERHFDAQIAVMTSRDPALQKRQAASTTPSLETRLRIVEALIRDAGDALSETSTLGSARHYYAKAADYLAETLHSLAHTSR